MHLLLTAFLLAAPVESLEQLGPPQVLELKGETHHVQGVEVDARTLWVTSVDRANRKGYLFEFSLATGEMLRQIEVQDGDRFHPGGIASDGESLWLPISEYKPHSSTVIQKRNKRTLGVEFQFEVADSIGCVAANGTVLVGGNWDSRDLYVWDHRGKLIRTTPNETPNAYQDLKFDKGLLVASGVLPGKEGAIDWLEFPSMKMMRRIKAGKTDRGSPFTREGMAIRDGRLYLLPEDGPSRLYTFLLESQR